MDDEIIRLLCANWLSCVDRADEAKQQRDGYEDQVEDIICFEVESGAASWTGSVADLQHELEVLQRLAHDGVIELDLTGTAAHMSGVDRVGLIVLASGRRLVIRSNIGSLRLLDWFAYLGKFPYLDLRWCDNG